MRLKKRTALGAVLGCFVFLAFRSYISWIDSFLHVQLHHFRHDYAKTLSLLHLSSYFSKGPMMQIVDSDTIDILWETRVNPTHLFPPDTDTSFESGKMKASVHWLRENAKEGTVLANLKVLPGGYYIYRARLTGLGSAFWVYKIDQGSFKSIYFQGPSVSQSTDLTRPILSNRLGVDNDNKEPITIGVIGDNQFAAVKFTRVLKRMRKQAMKIDYMIHVGDAVQEAISPRAWQTDFFDPVASNNLLDVPWIMLHGNHDFPAPYTSEPIAKETYKGWHSLTISSVFFVVLDSNHDSGEQDKFLRSELASDLAQGASHRVVLVHIPPYVEYWEPGAWTSGEKHWGEFVRDRYVAIFEEFQVNLVISGHQHNYQRGTRNGVTYVIAGGAGGTLDKQRVEDYGFMAKTVTQHHFGFLTVGIHDRTLRWTMYDVNGQMHDNIEL